MRNTGERVVSQKGYRVDMLNKFRADVMKVRDIINTPAADNLVTGEDNTEAYEGPNHYLSIVMAVMYIARFTRPEVLFAVSYLATKGMKPSIRDYQAACRILRYLECSGDYGLLYKKGDSGKNRITCDASHVLHKDGKGQGGITVSVGSAIVHAKSNKIKLNLHSSCESEGYMTSKAGTYAVFMIALTRALNMNISEIPSIKQDNQSNIWLQSHDGKFNRNKHILARRNYVKDLLEDKVLTVTHADTDYLESDMMTKVVSLIIQTRHMKRCGLVYLGLRIDSLETKGNKMSRIKETGSINRNEHMSKKIINIIVTKPVDMSMINDNKKVINGVISNEKRIKKRVVIQENEDE